jgi:hypothetical protein
MYRKFKNCFHTSGKNICDEITLTEFLTAIDIDERIKR